MVHPGLSFRNIVASPGETGSELMVDEKAKEAFLRNLVLVNGYQKFLKVSALE